MATETFTSHALTLTERPVPTTAGPVSRPPQQPSEPGVVERVQRIAGDVGALAERGILILTMGPSGDHVEILLAVADPASVQYLSQHYGKVSCSGWLQRHLLLFVFHRLPMHLLLTG